MAAEGEILTTKSAADTRAGNRPQSRDKRSDVANIPSRTGLSKIEPCTQSKRWVVVVDVVLVGRVAVAVADGDQSGHGHGHGHDDGHDPLRLLRDCG